jgi:hypothetical protein
MTLILPTIKSPNPLKRFDPVQRFSEVGEDGCCFNHPFGLVAEQVLFSSSSAKILQRPF